MSKAKKKDTNERVRKIGEREEAIETRLSSEELGEVRETVMILLDDLDLIEGKKKEAMKNFASQAATIELQVEGARNLLKSKVRRTTVIVDEYLTQGNEVHRVRRDTGEQLGARTATAAELQEEMFTDPPPAPADLVEPSPPLTDEDLQFASGEAFGDAS
jgi:hypothetical protein